MLCIFSFVCFILVRKFRGIIKTSYLCLLFWPGPLLKLSPLQQFFIINLLINLPFAWCYLGSECTFHLCYGWP